MVGTKSDLLDKDQREISIDEAVEFARDINKDVDLSRLKGEPYFETSSKTGYNVSNVFEYMFEYCLPLGDSDKNQKVECSTVDLTQSTRTNKPCCAH